MTRPFRASIHWRLLLLALGLLAFFGVWVWDLAAPALTGDEAFITLLSGQPAAEILARLNADEPHPPVYYLAMRGWRLLSGKSNEFLIRYPSVLIGMLVLSLVYGLGHDLELGALGAAVAAALLGLSPHFTIHVREARMYGAMVLGVALATRVAWRCERARAGLWAAALASLLALFTHYFNMLFVAALGLWGLLAFRGRARRDWVIAQGLAWAALAVWLMAFGRGFFNPASLSTGKTWSLILPPWETLARLAAAGVLGYRGYEQNPLAFVAAPLLVAGWLLGCRESRGRARGLLVLMVAGPLVLYALLGAVRPVFHPKYTLPWLLFAALAFGALVRQRRWAGSLAAAALFVLMAGPALDTVRRPYEAGLAVPPGEALTALPRELGRELQQLAGPADVFGLGTPDPAHCYYTQQYFERDLGCALIPASPSQTLAELNVQVQALLAQHRLLWYLEFYNPAWDPGQIAPAALGQSAMALGTADLAGRRLQLYVSPDRVERERQAVGARFSEVAGLEGVWLAHAQALHVVLTWRALADQPDVEAKVFVHLIDASGLVMAQSDGLPVNWTRPLPTWRAGERLLDVHALALPPDADLASATLRVGLYNPNTLERLPAYDAAGRRLPDDAAPIALELSQ